MPYANPRCHPISCKSLGNLLSLGNPWLWRDDSPDKMRLLRFKVLQPGSTSGAQAAPRLFDAAQEARVMFETVVEPVLFRLEADQYAGRFTMARDDDLLRLSLAQIAGQIVLDFRKRDLFHSGFPKARTPSFRISELCEP